MRKKAKNTLNINLNNLPEDKKITISTKIVIENIPKVSRKTKTQKIVKETRGQYLPTLF